MLRSQPQTSYYALAAEQLLVSLGITPAATFDLPRIAAWQARPAARPAKPPRDLLAAMIFAEHGLADEARAILRTLPMSAVRGPERVAAAWLYAHGGDVYRSALLARRPVASSREVVRDPVLLQIAYPRAFGEIVARHALRSGVPEALLLAVIREESAFHVNALSPRAARGLMQMIPPTARQMAREVGIKRFRNRRLFDPETSIHLGSHYLASLLQRFDGNLVATIASYHAGETRVERWLASRKGLPFDEFIEDIPFPSTRGYVQKVLSSFAVYRLLYGSAREAALGLPLSTPIEAWQAQDAESRGLPHLAQADPQD